MSFPVKLRKLKRLYTKDETGSAEFIAFLSRLEKVVKFRDKIVHWSDIGYSPDPSLMRLVDIGRNPSDIFQVQMEVTIDDLNKVYKWLSEAHLPLFMISMGQTSEAYGYGKFELAHKARYLPQEDPPLP